MARKPRSQTPEAPEAPEAETTQEPATLPPQRDLQGRVLDQFGLPVNARARAERLAELNEPVDPATDEAVAARWLNKDIDFPDTAAPGDAPGAGVTDEAKDQDNG